MMEGDAFDRIVRNGRAAVLSGRHDTEVPPSQSGRWGLSVVLLPSSDLARSLDDLTNEATETIGDGHWRSGGMGRAHVTVRALEPYGDTPVPTGRANRYILALERAITGLRAVRLELEGLALSAGTVMARARCTDGTANELRQRLGTELGDDGWLEDRHFENGRDPIWYCSLVHFAGPITAPARLVKWVDSRTDIHIGGESFASVYLCRWDFDGTATAPVVIASVSTS